MRKLEKIKIRAIIGFGYWRNIYNANDHGVDGITHNVLFLCCHYQLSYLHEPTMKERKPSGFQKRLKDALSEQRRVREKIFNIKKND